MIELIVTETSIYGDQYLDSNLNNTYLDEWQPVASPEIKTYIGIFLLMGIIYKPQPPMYWSTNTLYNTPIFSEVINRNRFYIRFYLFTQYCLHKVRPFIDAMHK